MRQATGLARVLKPRQSVAPLLNGVQQRPWDESKNVAAVARRQRDAGGSIFR